MKTIDMAKIAELSSAGVLAAKVRITIRRVRDGMERTDADEVRLERAARYLRSALAGWHTLDRQTTGTRAVMALNDMQTVCQALGTANGSPSDYSEETRKLIERLAERCSRLSAGHKPADEDLDTIDAFFAALSQHVARNYSAELSEFGRAELPNAG